MEKSKNVEHAISHVYPSLVQIYVITTYYEDGREKKAEASGSGVIISPEGYVVTNHHVAGNAIAIRCILSTKEELSAKLIGTDALSDLAVLKLDLSQRSPEVRPLPVAHFGSSKDLKVGDPVWAMGCPLAISQSVTKGIVANKDMMFSKFIGGDLVLNGEDVGSLVKWIGHDAQIQPGNSGGPLVNLEGEIVGINEIGLGSMSGAIPSDLAKSVVQELIAHGKVKRAWLGAIFQPLLKGGIQTSQGLIPIHPDTPGVLVGGVVPDSPAERGGLQPGDIVVAVDENPVKVHFREELPSFHMLILSKPIGQIVRFKILRDGKEQTLSLTPELRENAEGKETEVKEWGVVIENITTLIAKELQLHNKHGALVTSVRPGGPASQAIPPIEAGDVIVQVGSSPIPNKEALLQSTAKLTEGTKVVSTAVTLERKDAHLITVVDVGIREPPPPAQESKKPWLPFATQVISKKLASALALPVAKGVRITQTYPEDHVQKTDFHVGDILTYIDGIPIEASEPEDADVFDAMIRNYRVGSKVEISILRSNKPMKVGVVLQERPKSEKEFKIYENVDLEFKARDISYFDRIKNRWNSNEPGAVVSEIQRGGWASVGGLLEGDLIQAVNGEKVMGIEDLELLVKKSRDPSSKGTVFLVKRGIHTFFLELEPTW